MHSTWMVRRDRVGTVRGRASNHIPAPILQVPVGYTAWLRRTGENGGAMRRRGGRGTTGARGMKRTTNGTGANARIAGLGTKGEAARRDSRSRGAVNVAFSTPRTERPRDQRPSLGRRLPWLARPGDIEIGTSAPPATQTLSVWRQVRRSGARQRPRVMANSARGSPV